MEFAVAISSLCRSPDFKWSQVLSCVGDPLKRVQHFLHAASIPVPLRAHGILNPSSKQSSQEPADPSPSSSFLLEDFAHQEKTKSTLRSEHKQRDGADIELIMNPSSRFE
ncbi:uncharacterized protein RCO7_14346 [Rhynchosporium graminicola]|uniref:Uncharacterized protein n=1 Tax=Rhynchosporium graminicola TaxID=2792576 RepID=A0A1E1KA91_9HELO|nr:uncharacterized protein RCO7_14346 [Rhynchosporium commune]